MAIQIEYNCTRHGIRRTSAEETIIAAYSSEYDFVHFTFCPEWTGMNKTIAFEHPEAGTFFVVPDANNVAAVPVEVNAVPGFWVSAFGTDGEGQRITSLRDFVTVERSALGPSTYASAPTPTVYDQLYKKIIHSDEVAQSVRDDADAGLFDGDPGPQGPTGATGATGPQGPQGNTGAVVEVEANAYGFGVDTNGHLILTYEGSPSDPPAFSIDSNGHLIYTIS